jgi:hypothetical protein
LKCQNLGKKERHDGKQPNAKNRVNNVGRGIYWVASFALAYFLAHQFAFFFPDSEKAIMAVWPAGGIGLAAFLLSPYRL